MKPTNIDAFKKLIERYETISLDEIKEEYLKPSNINAKNNLTGFGDISKCTLCRKAGPCNNCVYASEYFSGVLYCTDGINRATYYRILGADTPRKLLNAYRARAKFLRENYSKYLS